MKKYLLIIFAVFSALYIPSFVIALGDESLFYVRASDTKIYKKSANDTSI
jgi:hypothetical protein